ncbi:hypothetical protein KBC55_03605 [Patescibacteria group bacterium]|nr:hypothetical protein [Patescibacteria group bacterium]
MRAFLRTLFFAVLIAISLPSLPLATQAAPLSFEAIRVTTTGSGVLSMNPGDVKKVTVSFQNAGSSTWKNDGYGYISLYTYGPKYRKSAFDPGTWLSAQQVRRLSEVSVAPGAVGSVTFELRAPQTEGAYKETFHLAAEDLSWVPGGEFTLTVNVSKQAVSTAPVVAVNPSEGLDADLLAVSANSLAMKAGKSIVLSAAFTNTGTKTWSSYGLQTGDYGMASATSSSFAHSSWKGTKLAVVDGASVAPGAKAELSFFLTAPQQNGQHSVKLQLTANGNPVPEAFIELPVTVTGGSGEIVQAPLREDIEPTVAYIEEPIMRVGVLIVDEETNNEVAITSETSAFTLTNEAGDVLGSYDAGDIVWAAYVSGKYVYGTTAEAKAQSSTTPLRFVPEVDHAVMTIVNFDRRVTRGTSFANNTFRNVLEFRYNDDNDRSWIINEIAMEYYLRGLAETSNSSPMEYQKAILTAARTYAYFHLTRQNKHADEGFDVDAYRDQVYWGYDQEARNPLITKAVEDTRGRVVTIAGEIVITPYFSRSDGMTRDWDDVWAGKQDHLRSVVVPCDQGRTLWGHGVGISASGAICMANDGQTFEQILTYFYQGIAIEKKWE